MTTHAEPPAGQHLGPAHGPWQTRSLGAPQLAHASPVVERPPTPHRLLGAAKRRALMQMPTPEQAAAHNAATAAARQAKADYRTRWMAIAKEAAERAAQKKST